MSFLLTALAFIVIFSILVLIHEYGHFIVARKNDIKVEEFGFGLPPRIWGIKKGETLYSINAIPFGGFVRLLGEDARDSKVLKNPRSFASKPARVRILVILAGVIMNFLLAWLLLTIGFTFGIQPLILSGDDVLNAIQDGTIQIQPGVTVQTVKAGGPADVAGMKAGDKIVTIDGKSVSSEDELQTLVTTAKDKTVAVSVDRPDQGQLDLNIAAGPTGGLGFEPYQMMFLPRVTVQAVSSGVVVSQGNIRSGDIILKVNDKDIYTYDDYVAAISGSQEATLTLWRGDSYINVVVDFPTKNRTVISDVLPNTPAEKAGFKPGDLVMSVDTQEVVLPQDVITATQKNPQKSITYNIERDGATQQLQVQPNGQGLIGVGLSRVYPYENQFLSVYESDQPTTVLKIKDVHYPFWQAPFKALDESVRLAGLTVGMFLNVVKTFFTSLTIPAGVAGPVGIAQLTYTFVQQGVLSLLRFMALLSLSLAIINVLPIPALDGGRLFFILVEVVTGKRLNGRWEAVIHAIGFVVLMILIVAITYSDVIKLF